MKQLIGILSLLLVVPATAAYVTIATVGDGETLDLAERTDVNFATNAIVAQAGSTIRLADATLKAYLKVDGGEVTLVAPDGASTITLAGGLRELNNGALKVEGATKLALGLVTTSHAYWPMVDATNIAFTATEGVEGLALVDRIYVKNVPTDASCPVTVADGAWLAFTTSNALMQVSGCTDLSSFTLAGWNLQWMLDEVFPPDTTITVAGGATLAMKPCTVGSDNDWSGIRATDTANPNKYPQIPPFSHVTNIVLASTAEARARVLITSVRELDYMGEISGDGDFEMNAGIMENERTNLRGNLTFTGTVTLAGNKDGLIAYAASFGNPSNKVYMTGAGTRLQLRGTVPTPTNHVYVAELHTTRTDQMPYMNGDGTWEIGKFFGPAWLTGGGGTNRILQIDVLDAAAEPQMSAGCVLKLISAEPGAKLSSSLYGISLDMTLDLRDFTGDAIPPVYVQDDLRLTVLGGLPRDLFLTGPGAVSVPVGMTLKPMANRLSLDVATNETLRVDVSGAVATNWSAKVAQWYDASVPETLFGYPTNSDGTPVLYTNDYPIICRWGDRRYPETRGTNVWHMFNGRSLGNYDATGADAFKDRHDEVNPFVVKGGLNGLDYVSMGSYQGKIAYKYQNNSANEAIGLTEARRLTMVADGARGNITNPTVEQSCSYAILVFGSQQGGGAAILGGIGGVRKTTLDDPFFSSGSWPMFVDGVATNGATARPNGGWQIISLPLSGKSVNALGWNNGYTTSGGQNYAEVILFKSALTDDERVACERYLAKKWGLDANYDGPVGTLAPTLCVNGGGAIELTSDAEFEGGFCGTVTVPAGKTLVLSDVGVPPGDEVVPSANRLAWFDPDCTNTLYSSTSAKPFAVSRLAQRTQDGGVLSTTQNVMSGLTAGTDRRPWANRSARGYGSARTWIDFSNEYSKDGAGNTLRFQNSFSDGTGSNPIGSVREGFMVLDTSRNGGGTPIGVDVSMSTTRRSKAASAIWPQTSGVFTNVTTRLDNVAINGTDPNCRFSGRPEVFEFSFAAPWNPAFFGSYQDGQNAEGNWEIIGESIFYSMPLSAAQRAEVTAYLAYKWFGKVMKGYNDLSRLTVAGAGRVEAPSLAALPRAADGFSGTFACAARRYAFTLDPAANRTAATDAVTVAQPLELPADLAVEVSWTGDLRAGKYRLVTAPNLTLAGDGAPKLVLSGVNSLGYQPKLETSSTGLVLIVPSLGTQFIVR